VNSFYQCPQFQIILSRCNGCIQYIFHLPKKDTSWVQKSGDALLIQNVKFLIPKDCFELDSGWSSAETGSGINDLKKSYSLNIAIKEKEYKSYVLQQHQLLVEMAIQNCLVTTPCLLWMLKIWNMKMPILINIHGSLLKTLYRQMTDSQQINLLIAWCFLALSPIIEF